MDEIEKLKEKMNQEMKELKEELEEMLSGHKDKVRAEGEEPAGSSSKLLPIPPGAQLGGRWRVLEHPPASPGPVIQFVQIR